MDSNALICSGPVYLNTDHWFSSDATLTFSGGTTVYGNGHSVTFARNNNFITVVPGAKVEFRNVVFKEFSDDAFNLGSGATVIFGDQTTLEVMYSQSLSKDLIFTGNTVMNGFGNSMNLGSSTLNVVGSSSLKVKNFVLQGVQDHNINVAYNGALLLQDVKLLLSQDYSFTSGRCVFENQVLISGGKEFKYTTTSTSMIKSLGTVCFDHQTTFSYDPVIAKNNLFAMEDVTSVLFLNSCTIKASKVGLKLTRGTLMVDNYNALFNDSASYVTQGFMFGSGIVADSLNVVIFPGASLDLKSGFLSYNNVNA